MSEAAIKFDTAVYGDPREVAEAAAESPVAAVRAAKGGDLTNWLRNRVGNSTAADQVERIVAEEPFEKIAGGRIARVIDPNVPMKLDGEEVTEESLLEGAKEVAGNRTRRNLARVDLYLRLAEVAEAGDVGLPPRAIHSLIEWRRRAGELLSYTSPVWNQVRLARRQVVIGMTEAENAKRERRSLKLERPKGLQQYIEFLGGEPFYAQPAGAHAHPGDSLRKGDAVYDIPLGGEGGVTVASGDEGVLVGDPEPTGLLISRKGGELEGAGEVVPMPEADVPCPYRDERGSLAALLAAILDEGRAEALRADARDAAERPGAPSWMSELADKSDNGDIAASVAAAETAVVASIWNNAKKRQKDARKAVQRQHEDLEQYAEDIRQRVRERKEGAAELLRDARRISTKRTPVMVGALATLPFVFWAWAVTEANWLFAFAVVLPLGGVAVSRGLEKRKTALERQSEAAMERAVEFEREGMEAIERRREALETNPEEGDPADLFLERGARRSPGLPNRSATASDAPADVDGEFSGDLPFSVPSGRGFFLAGDVAVCRLCPAVGVDVRGRVVSMSGRVNDANGNDPESEG